MSCVKRKESILVLSFWVFVIVNVGLFVVFMTKFLPLCKDGCRISSLHPTECFSLILPKPFFHLHLLSLSGVAKFEGGADGRKKDKMMRDILVTFSFSSPVCFHFYSFPCCCCNKLSILQTSSLKNTLTLYVSVLEVRRIPWVFWAKIKVLAEFHSFWGLQGRVCSLPFPGFCRSLTFPGLWPPPPFPTCITPTSAALSRLVSRTLTLMRVLIITWGPIGWSRITSPFRVFNWIITEQSLLPVRPHFHWFWWLESGSLWGVLVFCLLTALGTVKKYSEQILSTVPLGTSSAISLWILKISLCDR